MFTHQTCAPVLESLEARTLLSADLAIANLAVEGTPIAGSLMSVSYDLTNTGDEPAEAWQDMIQVSKSSRPFLGCPTFATGINGFGAAIHNDPLDPGQTIRVTEQVQLMPRLTGRYYVVVVANWENMLDEGGRTADNVAKMLCTIVLPPPIDLTPTALAVSALKTGQQATITWDVSNLAAVGSSSFWSDEVYFSRDAKLGRTDVLLGTIGQCMPLAANGQYQGELTFDVPNHVLGAGYIIVKVNADRGANEGSAIRNNLIVQAVTVEGMQFTNFYSGMFLPRSLANVLNVKSHLQAEGQLSIAIASYEAFGMDTGADMGGQTSGTLVDAKPLPAGAWQGNVVLDTSGLAYGIYMLDVQIDQGGEILTQPYRLVLVEAAIRKNDRLGDTVGGDDYEHFNIDAGLVGDAVIWRLGTNHWHDEADDNGDFLVQVGAGRTLTRFGVALADRMTDSGADVLAGKLYAGATFTPGEVVPRYLAKIDTYQEQRDGQSFISGKDSAGGAAWEHDLFGGVRLDALGIPKTDLGAKTRIIIKHTMWCGNDAIEIDIGTLVVRWPKLPVQLARPKVLAITAKGDRVQDLSIVGPYAAGTSLVVASTVRAASGKDPVVAVIFEFDGQVVIDTTPRDKWTFPFEVGPLTPNTQVLVTAVALSGLSSELFNGLIQVA